MPHLLFVCHGNVARSPAAEVISRSSLAPGSGWTVASAGVGALTGRPVADDVARALRERGHDPGGHAARQVAATMLAEADLVLCMERAQREWLVDESPRDARKVLVLGQSRRIAAAAPRHVSGLAHLLLGHGPATAADDVPDPYRRGLPAARETVARLEDDLRAVLALLVPGLRGAGAASHPGGGAVPGTAGDAVVAHGLSTPRAG